MGADWVQYVCMDSVGLDWLRLVTVGLLGRFSMGVFGFQLFCKCFS